MIFGAVICFLIMALAIEDGTIDVAVITGVAGAVFSFIAWCKRKGRRPGKRFGQSNQNKGNFNGGSSDDRVGYEGSTHTGQDIRDVFVAPNGKEIDTTGYDWNTSFDGNSATNFRTGERVEKDIFGNITYTQDD